MVYSSKMLKLMMMLVACALSACDSNKPSTSLDQSASSASAEVAATNAYKPTATFQEIMDSVVDPSADFIWDSVSTLVDAKGVHETRPRTDQEWHEVRRRAILLAEAANLIAVPGRRVATGDRTVEGAEPLDVTQIQQRLDISHEQLVGFASALREVSMQLVVAADKKDIAAINELGGTLDEVCESCHTVFWYPEDVQTAAAK